MAIDLNTPISSASPSSFNPNAPPSSDMQDSSPHDLPMGTPPASWSAEQTKKVILSDFHRAAAFRSQNIEPKWQESMDTYLSEEGGAKYWEGTRNPRANLKARQAFQQINALRPQVIDALCGADIDFDVEAGSSGTTVTDLHNVRSLMQYNLQELGGLVRFQTFRSVVDRMTEEGLIYGNGVVEWGWDGPRTEQVPNWQKIVEPEMMAVQHPLDPGQTINMPTGRTTSRNVQGYIPKTISRFFLDPVPPTDFYVDPDTNGPNVQLAGFTIRRKMMTLAELASYRGVPGFDIPDDKMLYMLSRKQFYTTGDSTRDYNLSSQGINAPGNMDRSIDPRLARVEVLRYHQKGRHGWLIGRDHTAFNTVNQYNALPYFNWCYINKPGSFYGFSIPELLRTDQALIKQLLDNRLDELNLIIHPQMVVKRGTFRTASQSRIRPGGVIEAEDPNKDIKYDVRPNVTMGAYQEANEAENRAQKVTGVTDLAVLGTPSSGGNSANRTATGVAAQTNASNSRVHGLVATIEDTFLGPMFTQMWTLICMFMDPQQVLSILGPAGQSFQLDPVDLLNADPRFKMKTANNMKMRAAMQGGGLQQLTQFATNPELLSLLADQQNIVLDAQQFIETFLDVYNVKPFSLYRQMTPQEQEIKQQRQQQQGMQKMNLQNARLSAMGQQAQERDETQIMVALIKALAQAGVIGHISGIEGPVQLEARRLSAEIEGGQMQAPPPAPAAGENQ